MRLNRARMLAIGAAAVAIGALLVSPALGGPSLKQLIKKDVKKEVTRQLAGKTGPPGAQGPQGSQGIQGAAGTARAYAEVQPRGSGGCPGASAPQPCSFDRAKGIASVTWTGTGTYCVVTTDGISSLQVTALLSVDFSETTTPEGNASAQNNTFCNTSDFEVKTLRLPTTGTIAAAPADDVGFDILIP